MLGFGHLDSSDPSIFSEEYHVNVMGLYVHPAAHHSGIGKFLMREMERCVLLGGSDRLGVVATINAVPFYESVGFKVVQGHMHGSGPTALEAKVMVKDTLTH